MSELVILSHSWKLSNFRRGYLITGITPPSLFHLNRPVHWFPTYLLTRCLWRCAGGHVSHGWRHQRAHCVHTLRARCTYNWLPAFIVVCRLHCFNCSFCLPLLSPPVRSAVRLSVCLFIFLFITVCLCLMP